MTTNLGIESQTLKISSKQRRGTISGGIQGSASSSAKPNDVPRLETMLLAPSPRSMAALQSSKWHLSTPRLVSGGPRFFSSTREKADATPRSSRRQDCSVPTTATQAFQSPRDFIKGIEKLRNADSVAALLRPPDLTREDVELIYAGTSDDVQRLTQSLVSPLGQYSPTRLARTGPNLHVNPKKLVFDLTRDKPCIHTTASTNLDYSRKDVMWGRDEASKDKPCVSMPGQSTTAWRRDPEEYIEYTDQYAVTQRPGRGQRLKTASDRDFLPYSIAKHEKKEDGGYAKPLVGHRNHQRRQPTTASAKETTDARVVTSGRHILRSAFGEFRGTEPVALKRTVGYDGANMEMSPQTPHGYKQTEITKYDLEKWVDLYPDIKTPRMDTAQKKEREKQLLIRRALRGPPNMGQSMIPIAPVPDDFEIQLIEKPPLQDRIATVKFDARPVAIRQGKQDRGLLKLARKKIHQHVKELATPQYLPLQPPASAASSFVMKRMWDEYISYTRQKGVDRADGRLSKKDFGVLVRKLGMDRLTETNLDSLFKMADTDFSGAVDWSEFANLLVKNMSKE